MRLAPSYLPVMGDNMLTRNNLDAMGVYVWLRMLMIFLHVLASSIAVKVH